MPSEAQTLVLAQITERPKKDFKELRPMVTYMAEQLKEFGITSGEVRLFSNVSELVAAVKHGEVHWITETSFTAAKLVHEAGAKLIATKWKNGQQSYSSILYARSEHNIQSVTDLIGTTIAFENKNSFSSYFLPRLYLESQGLTLERLDNLRQVPAENKVGFVFSRNEVNNVLWVDKRLVAAGALNNGDWANRDRMPASIKSRLTIFYQSLPYPRSLEIVGPGLSPKIAKALTSKLLMMNSASDNGVMARYEQTTGFSPITPDIYHQLEQVYQHSLKWQEP